MVAAGAADAVAEFAQSLRSMSAADWYEAEEYLGEGQDAIKEAVRHASDPILAYADRAQAFESNLAVATKAAAEAKLPIAEETADLLVKFAVLAICAADQISEADYNTLVKPMRQAWANLPAWADLQQD